MSSGETSLYSIQCTNCGAPLQIYGGGRVTTITCQYCNSVLDLANHYKVLAQFNSKHRPLVPFTLGMTGKVKGVEWTIIGWVAYKTVDSPIERWSEFFLYSPLYGYGWLIYEEGEVSFGRRVRDFALRGWQDRGGSKSIFYKKGHYLLAEEPYSVEVDFVQGELSYIAKADDKIECWDYSGIKGKTISIEKSKNEIEVYLNERLETKDVYDSFGVKEEVLEEIKKEKEKEAKEKENTTDKLFDEEDIDDTKKPISTFAKGISLLAAILISTIIYSLFSEKILVKESTSRPFEQMFTVDSSAFISQIDIKAPSPQLLDNLRFKIFKSNKLVFSIDKNGSYTNKTAKTSTWKSGWDDALTIYTKLDEGLYRASLQFVYPSEHNPKISVTIKERVVRLKYIVPLLIIMIIILLPTIKEKFISRKQAKFVWWSLAGLVAMALFGAGAIIFIIIAYSVIQQMSSDKANTSSMSWGDDTSSMSWGDDMMGDD